MNDAERRELNTMRARVADLERQMKGIPSRFAGGSAVRELRICVVMGGNLINPGALTGVAYTATAPASIPDYDAASIPSTVNGIGVAYDAQAAEYVLFANYSSATIFGGSVQNPRDIFAGEYVLLGPATTLPITGGGGATKTLYVVVGIG